MQSPAVHRSNRDAAASSPRPLVSRVTSVAAELAPFTDEAVAAGQVNLIVLDALADRLADKWQGRREMIYSALERTLAKRCGKAGAYTRISETEYLVLIPELGRYAAQAACLRALGDTLKQFLGVAPQSDLRVRSVHSISGARASARPVDPSAVMEGDAREAAEAEAANRLAAFEAEAEADPTLLSAERWSPFVGASGRKVRVSCVLEPVFELRGNTRIGYRLNRRVIDSATEAALTPREIGNLSRGDHLRIDMATISRGLARLEADGDQALSLIIPVSYYTLSHQEGRRMLSHAFARARKAVLKGVLCEICDVEGVPQSALMSAVALIRPWSLFVIGHLTNDPPRASPSLRDAGVQAISFTCPPAVDGDAEFLGWLKDCLRSAHKVAKTTLVYGCTPQRMMLAGMMGATHASVAGPPR